MPRDRAFGKDDQRPPALHQDINCRVDCLAVVALAKDAERPHSPDHERLETALLEQMPTGHRHRMTIGLHTQDAEHQWIGHAAMVGREHDAMLRGARCPQPFHVPAFDRVNAKRLAQIAPQVRAKQDRPPLRIHGRHEFIGFVDDDFLHGDPRTCSRKLSQSAQPEDAAIAYPTRTVSAQGKRSR